MTAERAWFVVMSKPRPRMVRRQGRYLTEVSPMFPRYLFVRPFHDEQSVSSIRSTLGVQQLVRFGAEFAQAAESIVSGIRAMEARLRDDPNLLPFSAGDEVEITEGPFAGIMATVFACSESRVMLLFQLLGSIRKLDFSLDQCRRV
jgi:transcriptional antiterminator RfaH